MIRTVSRGLVYALVVLLFSPVLVPALVLGLLFAALRVGFSVGSNLLVHFLLTFRTNRYETTSHGLPAGVEFVSRKKGRRQ